MESAIREAEKMQSKIGGHGAGGKKVPGQSMMELQLGLKNNQREIENYFTDLQSWAKEVGEKDKNTTLRKQAADKVSTHLLF